MSNTIRQLENSIIVRSFKEDDFPTVKDIYQQGMDTKNASFELAAPDWEIWNKKFIQNPRLVAVFQNQIVGWVALSAYSSRCVFDGVCEVSIYIHSEFQGKGVGKLLLKAIIEASEKMNIWTLQAGIFPENTGSIKLHTEAGFREVGFREKIGKMEEKWRDVIILERRSKAVGID